MKTGSTIPHILLTLLCFLPLSTHASVVISEVAWMGSEESANAEWIELYNTDSEVNLDGWTLEAVDGQPAIELSGVLESGAHALLERTSDETVSAVEAYLIYTGSLGNSGEKLELRNSDGVLVDSVDGRDGWSIGGDNETKETLQRSGNPPTGGWVTDTPSPQSEAYVERTENDEEEQEESKIQETVSQGNIIYGTKKEKEVREKLKPSLNLEVSTDRNVITGVPAHFTARAYTESGREIELTSTNWNFGDGQTAQGNEVTHVYTHEGDYVVTVTGERKNFIEHIRDEEQTIVHVIPSPIRITEVTREYVTLKNESNEMLELSSCVLVSGGKHFKIPKDTYILGNAEITLPKKITRLVTNSHTVLFNKEGIALSESASPETPFERHKVAGTHTSVKKQAQTETVPTTEASESDGAVVDGITQLADKDTLLATAHADTGEAETEGSGNIWWWILGLITAIVTSVIAIILIRQEQREVIEGYYIEEGEKK